MGGWGGAKLLVKSLQCTVFRCASISSSPSIRPSHTFGFPFCQHLTKHRDDIVVADMVADMVADIVVDMVADIVVDIMADLVANMYFQWCSKFAQFLTIATFDFWVQCNF